MDKTIWISLVVIYLILLYTYMRVTHFWGTIYKIHDLTGIDIKDLRAACPPNYYYLKKVPRLRWAALLALFFFNWIAGIICLVIEIVVPVTLTVPEHDDFRNIEIMKKYLYKRNDNNSKQMYNIIEEIRNSPPSLSDPGCPYFSRNDTPFFCVLFLLWKERIKLKFKQWLNNDIGKLKT